MRGASIAKKFTPNTAQKKMLAVFRTRTSTRQGIRQSPLKPLLFFHRISPIFRKYYGVVGSMRSVSVARKFIPITVLKMRQDLHVSFSDARPRKERLGKPTFKAGSFFFAKYLQFSVNIMMLLVPCEVPPLRRKSRRLLY